VVQCDDHALDLANDQTFVTPSLDNISIIRAKCLSGWILPEQLARALYCALALILALRL